MAINFLNNISLNYAELQNPRIWPLSSNPTNFPFGEAGTVAEKQAYLGTTYFNTAIGGGLKIWTQTGSSSSDFSFSNVGGSFTLTADGPSGANSFVVAAGTTVDLLGGTNITTSRGGGAASNQFTITTTATPDQTVTLSGAVTGSGKTAITTTLQQVVDTTKFVASSLTVSTEDFVTNAVDTQIPTTLSVKNYVDEILTGDLVFLGGFNATTGEITSGEFAESQLYNGDTSARAVAADRYFVVTEPGDFFGSGTFTLTLGDRVVAAVPIPTNTIFNDGKITSDWTIIQTSNELATLTTVGIGNVGAGIATSGIDVTYNQGTASLVLDANELDAGSGTPVTLVGTNSAGATKKFTESDVHSARGKKIPLTTATGVAGVTSGAITTWTIILATAWQTGIVGKDCMVEVYKDSDGSTVYAEVARTATTITVKFAVTAASGTYGVLLQNVA